MRKVGAIAAAGMMIVAAACAGPRLEVVPSEFDFGRQSTNEGAHPFRFVLKNTGDSLLTFKKLRAGCGCTKMSFPVDQLKPGEEAELTGTLSTTHFEGPIVKGIFVTTNETESGKTHLLRLKIMLPYSQTGLRFAPRYIQSFVARPFGDVWRAFINVENCNRDGQLQVLEVLPPDGWRCETSLPVVIKGEKTGRVVLSRDLGDGAPFPEVEFTLKTDCPDSPELRSRLRSRTRPREHAAGERAAATPSGTGAVKEIPKREEIRQAVRERLREPPRPKEVPAVVK